IFLAATPGLAAALYAAPKAVELSNPRAVRGAVQTCGEGRGAARGRLELRGAGRLVGRLARVRASHLAQLDKRSRAVEWGAVLRADVPVKVEASCRKSKIYHSGAAAQRIETAIAEQLGAPISGEAEVRVLARIENDLVTISVDTS